VCVCACVVCEDSPGAVIQIKLNECECVSPVCEKVVGGPIVLGATLEASAAQSMGTTTDSIYEGMCGVCTPHTAPS
jgi:hypothetical protein